MKSVLKFFPLFLLPMLAACDEEVNTISPKYAHDDVESVEDLPKCVESLRGTTYYVQDENMKYECNGSKWIKEITVETKSSAQSSSSSSKEDSGKDSSGSEKSSSSGKAESSSSAKSSSGKQSSSSVYYTIKLWGECTAEREGERRMQKDTLEMYYENEFICDPPRWRRMVAYDYPLEEMFNPDVEYGTLKDSRDGNTYRTVVIGDMEWMAENLRYKIPGDTVFDTGENCFRHQLRYCKTSGYLYSKDDSKIACPEGFLLPKTKALDEMHQLFPYGSSSKSSKAWYSENDSVIHYTNSNGLTVLPDGWYSNPTYWMDEYYERYAIDNYTYRTVVAYFVMGSSRKKGDPDCETSEKCHYIRCYRPLGGEEEE
jgi:uncharacterized protein (TIGR02145 family)